MDDQAPLIIFLGIVALVTGAVIWGHLLGRRKSRRDRRVGAAIAASAVAFVALVATLHFGIPVLEDFKVPGASFKDTLIGACIVWAICFAAWGIAIKCFMECFRRP